MRTACAGAVHVFTRPFARLPLPSPPAPSADRDDALARLAAEMAELYESRALYRRQLSDHLAASLPLPNTERHGTHDYSLTNLVSGLTYFYKDVLAVVRERRRRCSAAVGSAVGRPDGASLAA